MKNEQAIRFLTLFHLLSDSIIPYKNSMKTSFWPSSCIHHRSLLCTLIAINASVEHAPLNCLELYVDSALIIRSRKKEFNFGCTVPEKESMAFLHLPSSLALRTTSRPGFTLPIKASSLHFRPNSPIQNLTKISNWVVNVRSKSLNLLLSGALALGFSLSGVEFAEAKVGVNKPELLPKEFTTVIDVAGFLSDGQEKRLVQEITNIEKDTGFKLRVLAQNYPQTPGLAIRDFWQVDDRTIIFVADPTFGNILNFNVGASVDLDVPRSFWSRLAGKYGNMFYWKEKGEDASIEAAVMAISSCLREPVGPNNCSEVK